MILQTDYRLRTEIQHFGCYLCSLVWHVVMQTRKQIDVEWINQLYDDAVARELMNDKCFIDNPGGVLVLAGMPATYTNKHEPTNRLCAAGEIEVLCWERPRYGPDGKQTIGLDGKPSVWRHFTAGDGQGHVTYDPMGRARTVVEGRMVSKRVFKLGMAPAVGEA